MKKIRVVLLFFSSITILQCQSLYVIAQSGIPLIGRRVDWKYLTGKHDVPRNWHEADCDDSQWKSGKTSIGYGDGDDETRLEDMQGNYASVFLRKSFQVPADLNCDRLFLYLKYDDGFVAYLNGKKVVSASITPGDQGWEAEDHEATVYEEFVIADAGRLLRPGFNVLAIEGHNRSLQSSDFTLDPFLTAERSDQHFIADDYHRDLDVFEATLQDRSSYRTLRNFDHKQALQQLRSRIDDETSIDDFVSSLRKLVMQIGDCHAAVSTPLWPTSKSFLPVRLADSSAGLAALALNRDQHVDRQCPYIDSIDGVPLITWMAAAAKFVPAGSPQLVRQRSIQWLSQTEILRAEMGMNASPTVTLQLRSSDGSQRIEKRLRLTGQQYDVARVRLKATRRLEHDLGYVRIPTMRYSERLVDSTIERIKQFVDCEGLILDVRDNSGGSYDLLRSIYGIFVADGAEPYVANVACYRLSEVFRKNHIAYRPTYRASWSGWEPSERDSIENVRRIFRPQWQPLKEQFSEWHYMVLRRDSDSNPKLPLYDKPVVVLCNARSFSATDIFLSAFSDLPNATLVGQPSAGGSGSARTFELPKTRTEIRLSSMASFRPDGRLFDGNGVAVDVYVKPPLRDFTTDADSVLERAVRLLRASR